MIYRVVFPVSRRLPVPRHKDFESRAAAEAQLRLDPRTRRHH